MNIVECNDNRLAGSLQWSSLAAGMAKISYMDTSLTTVTINIPFQIGK
jgi:hypothetical protein